MAKKAETKKKTVVENCSFVGVKFDDKATEAIIIIARGLTNLTEVFKTQGIHIDTLMNVGCVVKEQETNG